MTQTILEPKVLGPSDGLRLQSGLRLVRIRIEAQKGDVFVGRVRDQPADAVFVGA